VHAYTTGDEAELYLNGKSLGVRKITEKNPYHLEWMVPYTPGELKAVARKGGREIATAVVRTAAAPAGFAIEADQTELDPRRRDLSYISVRIEDGEGNFHPTAARWVSFNIKGPARIVGIHNGDPMSHHDFHGDTVRTFNGLARVIIAATPGPDDDIKPNEDRKPGEIVVTASIRGWESKELRLNRTHQGNPEAAFGPEEAGARPTDVYDEGVPPVD